MLEGHAYNCCLIGIPLPESANRGIVELQKNLQQVEPGCAPDVILSNHLALARVRLLTPNDYTELSEILGRFAGSTQQMTIDARHLAPFEPGFHNQLALHAKPEHQILDLRALLFDQLNGYARPDTLRGSYRPTIVVTRKLFERTGFLIKSKWDMITGIPFDPDLAFTADRLALIGRVIGKTDPLGVLQTFPLKND